MKPFRFLLGLKVLRTWDRSIPRHIMHITAIQYGMIDNTYPSIRIEFDRGQTSIHAAIANEHLTNDCEITIYLLI